MLSFGRWGPHGSLLLLLVASLLFTVHSDEISAPEHDLVQYDIPTGTEDLGNAADLMDIEMNVVTKVMAASDDKAYFEASSLRYRPRYRPRLR